MKMTKKRNKTEDRPAYMKQYWLDNPDKVEQNRVRNRERYHAKKKELEELRKFKESVENENNAKKV